MWSLTRVERYILYVPSWLKECSSALEHLVHPEASSSSPLHPKKIQPIPYSYSPLLQSTRYSGSGAVQTAPEPNTLCPAAPPLLH